MRFLVRTTLVVLFILLSAAPAARAADVITVSGTGTALGTMKQIIAAFERSQSAVRVKLLPSVGSAGAIRAVDQGVLDIGLNGRPLNAQERLLAVRAIDYARTPFVFAVNRNVREGGLTGEEVVRIYRGEVALWKNGERVRVILRPSTDADTLIAKTISPELSAAVDDALGREGMIMAATNQECHELIARTPGAIGFSSLTQIATDDRKLKMLSWNGVAPTVANMQRGAYPLVKTLSVIVRPEPRPAVRSFLRFLAGPESRRILERTGNAPLDLPKF